VENAIDQLSQPKENRSTNAYDNIKCIVFDDPVSSIDDTKIIKVAIKIIELIEKSDYILYEVNKREKELIKQNFSEDYIKGKLKEYEKELLKNYRETKLDFLITTHHALFYNVLYNSLNGKKKPRSIKKIGKLFYILSKGDNTLKLEKQNNASPF